MTFRVLDLFSGIGGFSLGLERTGGFETVAFCEIDPFCRRVLAKHWPRVPCYEDIRELTAARLAADGIAVDVICGGFPCQDVSFAGKRAGLEGARSGLWGEYGRLIGEIRPQFVIVENVPGLLSLGMGTVLGDLSTLGYDAVWDCVPASAVGAPHRRDRVWLVGYANDGSQPTLSQHDEAPRLPRVASDAIGHQLRQQSGRFDGSNWACAPQPSEYGCKRDVADAAGNRRQSRLCEADAQQDGDQSANGSADVADTYIPVASQGWEQRSGQFLRAGCNPQAHPRGGPASDWLTEPDVGRVAHGVPYRVDRLRSLGNAVVPQIPEILGNAILESIQ